MDKPADPTPANDNGSEQPEEGPSSETDKIWRSARSVEIPTGSAANVLAYTFANLGQYDENKPVGEPVFSAAHNKSDSMTIL